MCLLRMAGAARADQTIDAGQSPVVNVWLDSGKLDVETWDQPTVSVQNQGPLSVVHRSAAETGPTPQFLPIDDESINTMYGPVDMPASRFVLPDLGAGHESVSARGTGDTTVMIPRGTALVIAHVAQGSVHLANYNGTFVTQVHVGGIHLDHVNGTGFAQTLRGPVVADASNFSRVRVRTAMGNMLFRGCTSNQIEATSKYGSIVYDNGSFKPGLAHFESEHGNVALGVQGDAQIGAHSGTGHVVNEYGANHPDGPVITTNARNGSVYLYNGSMRTHPNVQQGLMEGRPVPPVYRPLVQPHERAAPPARPSAAQQPPPPPKSKKPPR